MNQYSIENQNARKRLYHEKYIDRLLQTGAYARINTRERVWTCTTLFEMGYDDTANITLRTIPMTPCAFMPMNLTELLVTYGKRIEPDLIERCKHYIVSMLDIAASPRTHISTYNDNFAIMAIYTLIIAGELFDLPEYTAIGKKKLAEVAEMLSRCGTVMEYSSGTYTAVDILPFAQLANHSRDPEVRKIALDCEHRLWADTVAHFHPTTSQLAGPHARSYPIDMLGHPHLYCSLMWKVFGDAVFINPINSWFPVISDKMHIHIGLDNLTLPNCAWIVNADYHCPDELAKLIYSRTYPYEVEETVECLASNDFKEAEDHDKGFGFLAPGHRSANYTYMLPEYSMGTAENQFHSGVVTDSFFLTYRNTAAPGNILGVGTASCRYIFNDHVLCRENNYACFGKTTKDGHRDEGRKFSIQNKNTAMVLYKPYHFEKDCVYSARLTVNFPIHFGNYLAALVNGEKIDLEAGYESDTLAPVVIETLECWFGFIPTMITDLGRTKAIDVRASGDFVTLSIYNYLGEAKAFSAEQLIYTQNGFVCVAGTKSEYPTSKAFFAHLAECDIREDRLEENERAITRRAHFVSPDTELRLQYSPLGDTVLVSAADKKPRGCQVFRATDIDNETLPFLS